ncbi:hypothetical protein [Halomonas sp. LBP4]|uniref:hypothetical protein n=1 Tax=Halomonas sp. LBP4 TaxID=2044917 RepID=UPI000D7738B6|nr:hypothetical protein [Halomonas sp. LBP4]PXX94717.1 hypothetical protein CR157_21015 [Halomonas sp. LBP4]
MSPEELLKLYEKLYFHELDSRDKLTSRLQLSLAVLTGLVGALGYILMRLNLEAASPAAGAIFIVSYASAVVLVGSAGWHFIRALWNHSYERLPVATAIEDYRDELVETYKEFDDGAEDVSHHFQDFLGRYFRECAEKNAEVNKIRADRLHDSLSFVVYSIGPILISVLSFALGGLVQATGS